MKYEIKEDKLSVVFSYEDGKVLDSRFGFYIKTTNGTLLYVCFYADQINQSYSCLRRHRKIIYCPVFETNEVVVCVCLYLCRNVFYHDLFRAIKFTMPSEFFLEKEIIIYLPRH